MHQLLGGMWNNISVNISLTIQLGVVYFTKNRIAISEGCYQGFHHLPNTSLWCLSSLSDCSHHYSLLFHCSCSVHHLIWSAPECFMQLSTVWPLKNFLDVWSTVTIKGSETAVRAVKLDILGFENQASMNRRFFATIQSSIKNK